MSLKFGTSGLRGLSVDLTGRAAALYATAFGRYLLESGRIAANDEVLVGRDYRDSSPEIATNCIDALAAVGLRPVDCGAIATPALALDALERDRACLMVTGSHIPADRNGIKFYRPDGEIDKADEAAISREAVRLEQEGFSLPKKAAGYAADDGATEERYFRRNASLLPPLALKGLRVGVYQHSTVARDMLARILACHGAEVVALGRSDRFIPVDTEAVTSETLDFLSAWAAEHRLDAIVSADGDGDRPLVADERGNPLRGDLLGLISANFLGASVVVTPVTSNSGIEASGTFRVERTRVGSPYVIAGMNDALHKGEDRVMGFEANGGVLTASAFTVSGSTLEPLPTRDCALPILAALHAANVEKQPLSAVAAAYKLPVADADRLEDFPQATSSALMARLRSSPDALARFLAPIGDVASTSDIDGLRVTLGDGRIIHFRPSGNAPEMRCYVEATTSEAAKALLDQGLDAIRGFAATVP
ncbi:phosphomannomutase [Rhizobiaceae bacterium n13]|uniref:Phosphomannomutase n=1 Tax=Ferirhizobium litorale TaxID=2927786 RepID=A0AAE3QFL9_9HYPH|nr:phosphomannomutase [Fererhizobium litorale]MDI7864522.1 phosphomannomutase [Fererhizobium litorale]MDI7924937.1 phosphomannomutase [Fererhizobium litorale]